MSRNVSFSMNTGVNGGADIIQHMAAPMIRKAGESIAERANKISPAIRATPQKFEVSETRIGLKNKRGGMRAYVEVRATKPVGGDAYYNDYQTLHLAVDAGRLSGGSWDS